jgi:L-malate glycosyltransferase
MSNALLEAMPAGRAVIATDVGVNAKLVEHGKSGLIVSPGDDSAIADAIGLYLAKPLRAAAFGAAARMRIEKDYSRDAMIQRFEEFYQKLMDRAALRPRAAAKLIA